MAFPQPFLDALTERNPIDEVVGQYVSLTRRGSNLFGLFPFHSEKTASFSVAQDKGIFYCFGCHAGGGVINFIMDIENLSYPDAVRFLAKRANIPVPEEASDGTEKLRRRMLELNRDAARWYYQTLQGPDGQAVRAYLDRCRAAGERMIVLTSSVPEHCRAALGRLGLTEYFQSILFAHDLGMDKKDPETFRHAAALMGVTPEECTVYDDSVAACRAARDAGMQVVGVYDEFFHVSWPEMCQVCHRVIRSFEELL